MNGVDLVLGVLLMVTGVGLVIAAVFRILGRGSNAAAYELWALTIFGVGLILLGRWVLQ